MENENTPETEEISKETDLKFAMWFYIAFALCVLVFVIVSAVTKDVCYWAAAIGFALIFAQFLLLFIKSKNILLIAVAVVSVLAFALMLTLWIMGLCA